MFISEDELKLTLSRPFQMRIGLDLNWLFDNFGSDFDLNLNYKGDFFPIGPLIISAELGPGKIDGSSLSHICLTFASHLPHICLTTDLN